MMAEAHAAAEVAPVRVAFARKKRRPKKDRLRGRSEGSGGGSGGAQQQQQQRAGEEEEQERGDEREETEEEEEEDALAKARRVRLEQQLRKRTGGVDAKKLLVSHEGKTGKGKRGKQKAGGADGMGAAASHRSLESIMESQFTANSTTASENAGLGSGVMGGLVESARSLRTHAKLMEQYVEEQLADAGVVAPTGRDSAGGAGAAVVSSADGGTPDGSRRGPSSVNVELLDQLPIGTAASHGGSAADTGAGAGEEAGDDGDLGGPLAWSTGIAEVALPIDYKLRNIEETERARKRLAPRKEQRAAARPLQGDGGQQGRNAPGVPGGGGGVGVGGRPGRGASSDSTLLRRVGHGAIGGDATRPAPEHARKHPRSGVTGAAKDGGGEPSAHEARKPSYRERSTDDLVMQRFKKRQRRGR